MTSIEVTTPQELIAALKAARGGEVIAAQGAFGAVNLQGIRPPTQVTVNGTPGAHFERLDLTNCANLHFSSLSCWPLGRVAPPPPKPDGKPGGPAIPYLVSADPTSANIEISHSIFRGRKDSDGHPNWSRADWQAAKIGAILLFCPGGVIRSNKAIGVYFGFIVKGRSSELFDNLVFGFAADGLRVGADNCVAIGNRITDAVRIDGNHPDAFQAFKKGALLRGLVVKDNVVVEWTVRSNNPLRAKLQGIGMYDGPYSDIVIRGNRVAISSPNGIRINAASNLIIRGNHVRHVDRIRGDFPRIMLSNCSGMVDMSNNQAEKFVPATGANNTEPDYNEVY